MDGGDAMNQCPHCGIKPRTYKRKGFYLCIRCDRAFDIASGGQIENYAWIKRDGIFIDRLKAFDGDHIALIKSLHGVP